MSGQVPGHEQKNPAGDPPTGISGWSFFFYKCINGISLRISCYFSDRHEIRGVFRGLFAKNPSGTAFAPFAKRIQHGRTQVTALRSNDSAPRGGVDSNKTEIKWRMIYYEHMTKN